jgi:peptidoglycan/xylan/chitin deacetylase (PgdA/CDA1 family)
MPDQNIWDGNYDEVAILKGAHERELLNNGYSPDEVGQMLYNPLHLHGNIDEPILDEKYLSENNPYPTWPQDAEFAVCLTHDVDHVHMSHFRQSIRELRQNFHQAINKKSPRYFVQGTFSVLEYLSSNKDAGIDRFQQILDIEQSFGTTSTFFVMPNHIGNTHNRDHFYRYDDSLEFGGQTMSIGELFAEIQNRGWEVGLHPTVGAHDDPEEMQMQKQSLDTVLKQPSKSVRSHCLWGDIRKTPTVLEHAGFKYDLSFGLKSRNGFRFGTSYPHQLYNWDRGDWSSILEIPNTIMDSYVGMEWYRLQGDEFNTDIPFEYVKEYTKRVRNVGGVLTLNFHSRPFKSESWRCFYERVLSYLDDQGAYIGSVEEIASYWESENTEIR